jgi:hypothetical protein
MTPKKWWDNLDIESRQKILRELGLTSIAPVEAAVAWDRLASPIQVSLKNYRYTHMGTVKVAVTAWSANQDRRPKKRYCSDCGALMRAGKCWRCGNE